MALTSPGDVDVCARHAIKTSPTPCTTVMNVISIPGIHRSNGRIMHAVANLQNIVRGRVLTVSSNEGKLWCSRVRYTLGYKSSLREPHWHVSSLSLSLPHTHTHTHTHSSFSFYSSFFCCILLFLAFSTISRGCFSASANVYISHITCERFTHC